MTRLALIIVFATYCCVAQARVYRCVDTKGLSTYQQTPCQGAVPEPVTEPAPDPEPTGYNAACTHYNGRLVLSLKDVSALPPAQRDKHLDWLLSEDAPSKEEKQACLTGRRVTDGAPAAPTAQEALAQAARDQQAALQAYSLFRTFARQISVCRTLTPTAANRAQDNLDRYLEGSAKLQAEGRRLARAGVTAGGSDGTTMTAADIEQDIRAKENAISSRFRAMTAATQNELVAECEAVAGLIEFQQTLSGV